MAIKIQNNIRETVYDNFEIAYQKKCDHYLFHNTLMENTLVEKAIILVLNEIKTPFKYLEYYMIKGFIWYFSESKEDYEAERSKLDKSYNTNQAADMLTAGDITRFIDLASIKKLQERNYSLNTSILPAHKETIPSDIQEIPPYKGQEENESERELAQTIKEFIKISYLANTLPSNISHVDVPELQPYWNDIVTKGVIKEEKGTNIAQQGLFFLQDKLAKEVIKNLEDPEEKPESIHNPSRDIDILDLNVKSQRKNRTFDRLSSLGLATNQDLIGREASKKALELVGKCILHALEISPNKSITPVKQIATYVFDLAYVSADKVVKDKIITHLKANENTQELTISKKIQLLISTLFSYPITRLILFYGLGFFSLKIYRAIILPISLRILSVIRTKIPLFAVNTYRSLALFINNWGPRFMIQQANFVLWIIPLIVEFHAGNLLARALYNVSSYSNFSIPFKPICDVRDSMLLIANSLLNLGFSHKGVIYSKNPWEHSNYILKGDSARKKWLEHFIAR